MGTRKLRARYVELELRDEDQVRDDVVFGVLHVRTQDGELIAFEKDLLQSMYVPVHDAGEVVIGGGTS